MRKNEVNLSRNFTWCRVNNTSPRKSSFQQRTYEAYVKDAVEDAVSPSQDETSNSASLSSSDKVVEKRLQKSFILKTTSDRVKTSKLYNKKPLW